MSCCSLNKFRYILQFSNLGPSKYFGFKFLANRKLFIFLSSDLAFGLKVVLLDRYRLGDGPPPTEMVHQLRNNVFFSSLFYRIEFTNS